METFLEQPGEKERTEARATKGMKDLILKASLMEGRSTSDFVAASAFEAARETIRTTLELSVRDQIAFAESAIKQSSPNERLRKAADRSGCPGNCRILYPVRVFSKPFGRSSLHGEKDPAVSSCTSGTPGKTGVRQVLQGERYWRRPYS